MSKTKAQKDAEAANEVDGQEFDRDGNPKFKVTDEGTQVDRDENGNPIPVAEYELDDSTAGQETSDKLRAENAAMGAGARNLGGNPAGGRGPATPVSAPPLPSTGRNAGATAAELGHDGSDAEFHPDRQIVIDGRRVEYPDVHLRPRQINVGGVNYEHVGEDEHGVWTYRSM
jgi:hypothetical protein